MFERGYDKNIELNGSYPDEYKIENNTFFSETIIQTDVGMFACIEEGEKKTISVFFSLNKLPNTIILLI